MSLSATVAEIWAFEVFEKVPRGQFVNIGVDDRDDRSCDVNSSTLGVIGVGVWSLETVFSTILSRFDLSDAVLACSPIIAQHNVPFLTVLPC